MIVGAVLLLIGLLGLAIALVVKSRAKLQATWHCVPGAVTRSTVELTNVFGPIVEYQYVYEGKLTRGDKIYTLAVGVIWPGPANRTAQRYPVGSTINVYVDPKNPSNSVLEPGGDPKFIPFVLTMAAIVIYAAVRFLLAAVR